MKREATGSAGAEQASNGSELNAKLLPPFFEEPATRPWAPPSDQRSCCQTPITLDESAGLTATNGSTSESR